MSTWPFIFLSVILNTIAQLLLKRGMQQIGYFNFSPEQVMHVALKVVLNIPIILGLGTYVVSVIAWLFVLSRIEVSLAYPLSSLGYITTALAALIFFHEPLGLMRIIGILVIITGVYILARS